MNGKKILILVFFFDSFSMDAILTLNQGESLFFSHYDPDLVKTLTKRSK